MNPSNTTSSRPNMQHIDRKLWKRTEPPKPYRSRFAELFDLEDVPDESVAVRASQSHNTTADQRVEPDPSAQPASIPVKHEKRWSFSHSLVHSAVRMIHGAKKDRSKSAPMPDEEACGVEEFLALANDRGQVDSRDAFPVEALLGQNISVVITHTECDSGRK
ncbi:hypothetical protein P171DRAFT_433122 [Karstenula rhodostoma CBS 690.94]|uniref:Uncharacterized protein n=1 Tax=Karstenula rhodostoma CBS 690.94 TaxID=1392251 RepID=A0A9P4PGF7_9PLEO|nr:hypothetical protein P171DRAFT_433122 [Karstenula rhodostoma CBS 690.94]